MVFELFRNIFVDFLHSWKYFFWFIVNRGEGLACSDAWLLKLGNEELFEATDINNSTKQCLPSCEYETITTSISSASFPLLESFHHTSYFCFVLAKLARICRNRKSSKSSNFWTKSFKWNNLPGNQKCISIQLVMLERSKATTQNHWRLPQN